MEIIVVIGGPLDKGAIRRWLNQKLQQKDSQEFQFIGVDGGCLKLMEEELPIDLAIGDFDSISVEDKETLKEVFTFFLNQINKRVLNHSKF